jgi:hypothetical protein
LIRSPLGRSIITVGVSNSGKPKALEFAVSRPILNTDDEVPFGSYPEI